jgi:hypothetical protein
MMRHTLAAARLTALGTILAAGAPAAAQVLEQQGDQPRAESWQAEAGLRNSIIRSTGYDPFSGSDVLLQISFAAERVFVRQGGFAFAAGGAVDYGASTADARNASAEFGMWRLAAVAEGRYYRWERAYAFARVAPGMLRGSAQLSDPSSPNGTPLADHFDVLSADASLGAALRLSGPANPIAVWLTAAGGYGWAGSHHLLLAPEAAPRDQAKLAPVDLGTIDPRGAFFRLAVAITY